MDFASLFVGIAIGFALAWLIKRSQSSQPPDAHELNSLRSQLQHATNESSGFKSTGEMLKADNAKLNDQLSVKQNEVVRLNNELTAENSKVKNIEERLHEQKTELLNLREQFTKEFENLATRIFEEKSKNLPIRIRQTLTNC